MISSLCLFSFQMFERESRREKILEARIREIRLKGRAKMAETAPPPQAAADLIERPDYCKIAEDEFAETVKKVHGNNLRFSNLSCRKMKCQP